MLGKRCFFIKTCHSVLAVISCLLIILATEVQAAEKQTEETWRLDAMPGAVLPRSLRFMTDEFSTDVVPAPSRLGLDKLRCSASAEFSGSGLVMLREKIFARAGNDADVYVVDLRKESHGFINGDIPISSYAKRNRGNYALNTAQVIQAEENLLQSIRGQEITFVPKGKTDTKMLTSCTVNVGLSESEESLVTRQGMRYKRIAVTDQESPTDENIDEFMAFYTNLPSNAWLHFHCHAGHGRTTSFVVFYDILCNPDVSFDDIVARQYALGGTNLMAERKKDNWKNDEIRKRAGQIRKFYDYVQANRGAKFAKNFSQWAKER